MNLTQKAYARRRVENIERLKLRKIIKSNYETDPVNFNPEKRFKLFKAGQFELHPKNFKKGKNPFQGRNYIYFHDAFLFKGEKEKEFNEKKYEADRQKITDQANKICDQIMLGDAEKSLDLIQKFEK